MLKEFGYFRLILHLIELNSLIAFKIDFFNL